jgi:GntR family transcriptional regulator of vanillate catabolism
LWKLCGSPIVEDTVERLVRLPFAAPNAFALGRSRLQPLGDSLIRANQQYLSIIDAIEHREGSRDESLACEHSRAAADYLRRLLYDRASQSELEGASLRLIVGD